MVNNKKNNRNTVSKSTLAMVILLTKIDLTGVERLLIEEGMELMTLMRMIWKEQMMGMMILT